jgi:2-polyprenyl-3-methyl-5-hydroxy-6-metoxy-1,4-benzoquinol methylase
MARCALGFECRCGRGRQWSKFVTPAEMRRYTTQSGMHMQKLTGMVFNPLTYTYALSPHPSRKEWSRSRSWGVPASAIPS